MVLAYADPANRDAYKKKFGQDTKLGARRTTIETAPIVAELPRHAAIEREPVTVLVSEKGWARAVGGHDVDLEAVKFKEGDKHRFAVKAETTDLLLIQLGINSIEELPHISPLLEDGAQGFDDQR